MKFCNDTQQKLHSRRAFTILESVLAMAVVAIVAGAVLTALTSGMFTLRMGRENLRASQVMLEKVETIRLYSWDQLTSNGFVPTNFTAAYDPNNNTNQGVVYTGAISIAPAAIGNSYSNDIKQIKVTLDWTTGGLQRSRSFTTYFSRYGAQDYIY